MDGHLRELHAMCTAEAGFAPACTDYMETIQGGRMLPWMRRDLVDWLQEVTHFYKFYSETLGLTVNLLDRYLALHPIHLQHLQLVGATCLLIAAKIKERKTPRLSELVAMSTGAFNREDIKYMERLVLHTLRWRMEAVTPHQYVYKLLTLFRIEGDLAASVIKYSELVLDVVLPEYQFIRYSPSVLGATAVLCGLAFLKVLTPELIVSVTTSIGIELSTLQECSRSAMHLFTEAFPSFEVPQNLALELQAPIATSRTPLALSTLPTFPLLPLSVQAQGPLMAASPWSAAFASVRS